MIRLLIIGRSSSTLAQRFEEALGDAVDLDTARLPSAGIRQFEATPADLILIVDEFGGERVETLVHAIRHRPLGQLVPLMLLGPLPEGSLKEEKEATLDLLAWLPLETPIHQIWQKIEQELGISAPVSPPQSSSESPSPSPSPSQPATPPPAQKIRLEPLDEEPPFIDPPRQPGVRSIFPARQDFELEGTVNAEMIERKLKDVRHRDYYAILEIRRGAENQTVREAFHRLSALFSPRNIDFELAHRFQNELAEIGDALEDAWAVLGDPDLRQPYLTHTLRK